MHFVETLYRRYGQKHLRAMLTLAVISNLMIVAPSLHMLQVYNRVLASYSIETLVSLTAIILLALAVYGVTEMLRGRVAQRLSNAYCVAVAERLFDGFAEHDASPARSAQNLRDFAVVRAFLSGRTTPSLFDILFVPFFLFILFLTHWSVGVLTVIGAAALAGLSYLNIKSSEYGQKEARNAEAEVNTIAQSALARGEDVASLGLAPNLKGWWLRRLASALTHSDATTHNASTYYAASRAIRQMLQVLLMAWAAFLVIKGEMSGGLIFLASMISGKALAPIEHLIGSWDGLSKARDAFFSLEKELQRRETGEALQYLPPAKGHLQIEDLVVAGDKFETTGVPLVDHVSLEIRPGEMIAIVGVSGAGKSILARVIAGAIVPHSGVIRLDNAARSQWPSAQWGRAIGYVAQETNLFPGTIAANIARFERNVPAEAIYAAARAAGVHETILGLPDGYQTQIADGSSKLSSGERKSIALARAFYGDPKVLVLDQPTLNLDQLAEQRFTKCLADAKQRGMTIIVISQRVEIMQLADRCYVMEAGKLRPLNLPGRPPVAQPQAAAQPAPVAPRPPVKAGVQQVTVSAQAPAVPPIIRPAPPAEAPTPPVPQTRSRAIDVIVRPQPTSATPPQPAKKPDLASAFHALSDKIERGVAHGPSSRRPTGTRR